MRKLGPVVLSIILLALMACGGGDSSGGESLYSEAKAMEEAGAYISANRLYTQALSRLRQEGNEALLKECRLGFKRTIMIVSDYSASEQDIRDTLSNFQGVTPGQIDYLISRIAYLDIEGKRYYFHDFMNTVYNIDLSIMEQLPGVMSRNRTAYGMLEPFVNTPGPTSGTPYINPINYQATGSYNIPRNLLPLTGVLKIWQPVAINTDCQTGVSIHSVSPEAYVKQAGTVNGPLGDIYFEVPLDSLVADLRIDLQFKFKHYEQRFTMIDPNNVGTYDKNSALYKEFTASGQNIFISPEIAAKALEVVGPEQNPYLAARKIYDYVVDDLTYSHMPHGSLQALHMPESVFVHNHRFGDCGAQSMYFAALCRSLGIPARATGGYQLFPGMEGTHFWAEFYLPNYGWVPVDTSVAQISKDLPELTAEQKRAFKDYFFGNMDPYRWVIQKDGDLPFSPPVPEPTALSMVLQSPAVLCDTIDGLPEETIWGYYRIQFSQTP